MASNTKSLSVMSPVINSISRSFIGVKSSFGSTSARTVCPSFNNFLISTLPICPVPPVTKHFIVSSPNYFIKKYSITNKKRQLNAFVKYFLRFFDQNK